MYVWLVGWLAGFGEAGAEHYRRSWDFYTANEHYLPEGDVNKSSPPVHRRLWKAKIKYTPPCLTGFCA